jgi:hypothetical protein
MTMTCDQASARLVDLPAGSEPDTDLALHLAGCDACRRQQADQAFVRQALASADWPALPIRREQADMPVPGQVATSRSDSMDGRQPAADRPQWTERSRHADGPGRSGRTLPPTSLLGRGRDLAFLGAIAAVIALVLARGWSAGRSAGPSPLDSRMDAPTETPVVTATVSVAVPPAAALAANIPDWVQQADPKRIGVIPLPDETLLLTGYDLLIEQELDFTLSPLWTVEDDAVCEAIWLDWGDGLGDDLPCHSPRAALPETRTESRYPLKHRYLQAGAYRPQVWMRQRQDAVLTGPAADFLVLDRHASQGPMVDKAAIDSTVMDTGYLIPGLAIALGLFLMILLKLAAPRRTPRWLRRVPAWVLGIGMLWILVGLPLLRMNAIPIHQIEPIIGRRGLDPLRPDAGLVQVTTSAGRRAGRGRLRLLFTDGQVRFAEPPILLSQREVDTPYGPIIPRHEDSLGRLRTVHAPVGLPFADLRRDGIGLSMPVELPRDPAADDALEFKEAWYRSACLSEGNLLPSPDERSVLLSRRHEGALRIYLLDLASGTQVVTHPLVRDVVWSPDSRWVVSRGADSRGAADRDGPMVTLTLRDRQNLSVQADMDIALESGYAASADGIWLAQADGVWRVDWPRGASTAAGAPDAGEDGHPLSLTPKRIFAWPADPGYQPQDGPRWIAPAPDGRTIAYGCPSGMCLVDDRGAPMAVVRSDFDQEATRHAIWRSDSGRLALLEIPRAVKDGYWSSYPWSGEGRGVGSSKLSVVDDRGRVLVDAFVSDGAANISPPRWTADGRWLIFTACPLDGRRIVAVDTEGGAALDLSQPGWDAWAALLPESGDLLLHNGRGGLWRSRLKVPLAAP